MVKGKLYRLAVELGFRTGNFIPFFKNGIDHFILVYHGVIPSANNQFNSRHEPIDIFEMHIQFLRKHFSIIPLTDFFQKKFLPGKINVAITFDDGYRNNFLYAKPILEKYRVPATIFVTGLNEIGSSILWADFLNIVSHYGQETVTIGDEVFRQKGVQYLSERSGRSLYEVIKKEKADYKYKEEMYQAFSTVKKIFNDPGLVDYWQLMSDDEIIECARSPFVTIGSHGYYHNNLGVIEKPAVRLELMKSKSYLEDLTQQPITALAYPDSSYSREAVAIAEEVGFLYQLAADNFSFAEDITDNRLRDRIGIYNCGHAGNQLLIPVKNHFTEWKNT